MRQLVWCSFLLAALMCAQGAHGADARRRGRTLNHFVPPGASVLTQVRADFSGEGREDIAALLSGERPQVIILLRQADQAYRRSARITLSACTAACVPEIRASGRHLLITTTSESAGQRSVAEQEIGMLKSSWFVLAESSKTTGSDLACAPEWPAQDGERCVESGTSTNHVTGTESSYVKFVNAADGQARVVRTKTAQSKRKPFPVSTVK